MNQEEFLKLIADSLGSSGIPYMLAGSFGSNFHGQPRTTNDVDIVIDPTRAQLDHWLDILGDGYYVSRGAVANALERRSMFNIIDVANGWKADLIVRKDRPYSIEEFQRRQTGIMHGDEYSIASAEDVILTKLEWNNITPSERQVQDAVNVAIAQGPKLDQSYLRKWAPSLGVTEQLEEILRTAEQAQH